MLEIDTSSGCITFSKIYAEKSRVHKLPISKTIGAAQNTSTKNPRKSRLIEKLHVE